MRYRQQFGTHQDGLPDTFLQPYSKYQKEQRNVHTVHLEYQAGQ